MKKEKINNNFTKNVKNRLKNLVDVNKSLDMDIYGSTNDDNLSSIDNTINKLNKNYTDQLNGKNLINALYDVLKEDDNNNLEKINAISKIVSEGDKSGIITSYLAENHNKITRYEDLMVITNMMPTLRDAKKALTNRIMSGDEVDKQFTFSVTNCKEPEKYEAILNSDEIKFRELVKESVMGTLVLGNYYISVTPYRKLYKKLIKQCEKLDKSANSVLKEESDIFKEEYSSASFKNIDILNEDTCLQLDDIFKETNISNNSQNKVLSDLANIVNDVNIYQGVTSLVDQDILMEEKDFINAIKNGTGINDSKKGNKHIDTNSESLFMDGLLDIDNVTDEPEIKGCRIKRLDIRRLVPLEVNNKTTILGYLYFENKDNSSMMKNPQKLNLSTMLKNAKTDKIEDLSKPLGNLLIKKLNKKFIEKNADIKSQIYDICKGALSEQTNFDIVYLAPDEVINMECENSESPFQSSIFFAKIYILLLMSSITAKVIRGNDVRVFYMNADAQEQISSDVASQIYNMKRLNSTPLFQNNASKMMGYNMFSDLYLIKNGEGNTPLEADVISGQNVDIPTDVLEMLEKIATDPVMPLQLLQSSSEVDFASSYPMLNSKHLYDVVHYQQQFAPAITKLRNKILSSYFYNDDNEMNAIVNQVFNFQMPTTLVLSNALNLINNARDYGTSIADIMIGDASEDEDASRLKNLVVYEICKEKVPSVPWEQYEKILQRSRIKLKEEKIRILDDTDSDLDNDGGSDSSDNYNIDNL